MILALGEREVIRVEVPTWKQYIEQMRRSSDGHNWLTVLKVALEIF